MFTSLKRIPNLRLLENEPLSKYTAARLGGPADALAIVQNQQTLLDAARWAHTNDVRWIVLGGGANVLVSDKGFRGLVIINQAKQSKIDADTGKVDAESGTNLTTLARRCMTKGLRGLEWAVSVPGTLGGAVVNNAGAHGSDMSENLVLAGVWNVQVNAIQTWSVDEMEYAYRNSKLKGKREHYLVLSAILQLVPAYEPTELNLTANSFIKHRKRTQPSGASLGSMFKNPPGDYAGRLIEEAGLKGHQIGGVQVSPIHANFFINVDNGTAADYSALIEFIRETVLEETGVELELEIEKIGEGFD